MMIVMMMWMMMMRMAVDDRGQISSIIVWLHIVQSVCGLLRIAHLDVGMLFRWTVVLYADRRRRFCLRQCLQVQHLRLGVMLLLLLLMTMLIWGGRLHRRGVMILVNVFVRIRRRNGFSALWM